MGLFPQDFPYCCPFPCLSRFGILRDPIHTEEHSAFHVFSKPFLAAVNFLLSSRLSSSTEVLRVEKALAQHCGKTVMTKMLRCARRADYVFRRQFLRALMGHASKLMLERWRQEDHTLENTFHSGEGSSSLPERVGMLLTL